MSALNWAIDMGQSCAITTLEEKVEALEKDMATARAWIEYLNKRVDDVERRIIERDIPEGGSRQTEG